MSFELVIFDCDGVLIDSEMLSVRADVELLAEHGIAVTVDQILDRYTGISLATMLDDLEARFGRPLPRFSDSHPRLRALFEAELTPIPGVIDMLDALACRRCIASSSTPERLSHSLSLVGLFDRFRPHVFSASEVARGKPAPDLFLHAARCMGAMPERCVVVEDSLPGIAAATAAGMTAIGFTGGAHCRPGHGARLRAAGAAFVISSMSELLPALAALGARRCCRDDKAAQARNSIGPFAGALPMPELQPFAAGGYRFITHQFQYSGGVAAEPGFRIERARFARPVPLAEGFDRIEAYLAGLGRPPTAFCACELRSPAQFTSAGFVAFNRHYVERLAAWGIFRDEINPVARSNVCPEIDPPGTPSFYAFSYTVPDDGRAARSFVAAGSGEAREGGPSYEGRIVRHGEQSPDAMREKARFVLGAMESRMGALGFGWPDVTATQVYTIYDIHPFLADEIVRRGAMAGGLTWHYARPPVQGLDFEMDVRGVARELVIS